MDTFVEHSVSDPLTLGGTLERLKRKLSVSRQEKRSRNKIWVLKAPVGYGKTSLLTHVARDIQESDGEVVWLDGTNYEQLIESIRGALGQDHEETRQRSSGMPRRYLFIDELVIGSEAEFDHLITILKEKISSFDQTYIATRHSTYVEHMSYRLFDLVEIIDQDNFILDEISIREIFEQQMTSPQIQAVLDLTDGWPFAVYALSACARASELAPLSSAVIDMLRDRLASIIEKEVLAKLSAPDADLLKRISLFEYADGDVINKVLGISDAWPRLDRLYREGALMRKFGSRGYRCHRLLREYISHHYSTGLIGGGEEFHRLAANAYSEAGMVWEALEHAKKSSQWRLVADILVKFGALRLAFASPFQAARYVVLIPEQAYSSFPLIALAQVYILIQVNKGGYAQDLFDQLERNGRLDGEGIVWVQRQLVRRVLDMYHDGVTPPSDIENLERDIVKRMAMDRLTQALIYLLKTYAYFRTGEVQEAIIFAERLREINNDLNAELFRNYTNLYVGLCLMKTGSVRQAEAVFTDIITSSERNFGEQNIQALVAIALLARSRMERLDMTDCARLNLALGPIEQFMRWYDGCEAAYTAAAFLWHETEGAASAISRLSALSERCRARKNVTQEILVSILKVRVLTRDKQHVEARLVLDQDVLSHFQQTDNRQACNDRPLYFKAKLCALELAVAQGHALDKPEDAQALFDEVRKCGDEILHLRVLILEALIAMGQQSRQRSFECLRRALRMALITGIKRTLYEKWGYLEPLVADMRQAGFLDSEELVLADELARLHQAGVMTGKDDPLLSPREREVLILLACGMSSKEMASRLRVSVGTVKGYRRNLYGKLGVSTRSQAIVIARDMGVNMPLH